MQRTAILDPNRASAQPGPRKQDSAQDKRGCPAAAPRRSLLCRFGRLVGGYFASSESRSAWAMAAALLVLTGLQILVQVRLNFWNRDFFDALENRDTAAFSHQILLFLGLAVAGMATAVLQLYARQVLQLRWRSWLVC